MFKENFFNRAEKPNYKSHENVKQEKEFKNSKELEMIVLEDEAEKETFEKIKEKLNQIEENREEGFEQEAENHGILSRLGENIKNNKIIRATLIGLYLFNATPGLAQTSNTAERTVRIENKYVISPMVADSMVKTLLERAKNGSIGVEKNNYSEIKEELSKFSDMSKAHKDQLKQVYLGASEEKKKIILDTLDEGYSFLNKKEILEANISKDPFFLTLKQQVIDLQDKGEIKTEREGGVVLPFDPEHSKKNDGVEFTNNRVEKSVIKINIEDKSENQIKAWINSLKNPERWSSDLKKWNTRNEEGLQNYPSE